MKHSTPTIIKLNDAESRRLMIGLIASQTPPTERMKRALKLHRETVTER